MRTLLVGTLMLFAASAHAQTTITPSQTRLIGCFGEAFTLVEHVWRIAPKFAPGDIAVFRDGDLNLLGRIVRADEREVMVTRAEGLERSVPRSAVVGRVFLTTR